MQKVPQIVRQRLQADPSSSHPDANLLTAFAERLLSKTERASVLEHLARCGDCREVVALALPEIEAAQPIGVPARSGWLSWPAFRWAVVTAGVTVIAIGGIEYQRHRPELAARFVKPLPHAESVVPDLPQGSSVPMAASSQSAERKKDSAGARSNGAADTVEARTLASRLTAPTTGRQVGSGSGSALGIHGGADAEAYRAEQPEPAPLDSAAHGSSAKQASPQAGPATAIPSETQSAAVRVQAANAESQVAQAAAPPAMFDRYEGAIGKAKPAITPAQDANIANAPRWSIGATGGLQRSYDQGMTWQEVNVSGTAAPLATPSLEAIPKSDLARRKTNQKALNAPAPPLTFRAVAANGPDVWAGGSNGALFHSVDSGNHWIRVLPSSAGLLLTGDIVGVDFPTPQNGSVSTSTGEVWDTTDGGQSWQKQ